MPFNPPLPRPFGEVSIRESAPALSGVYGVSNAVEWVYIGETDNIQEALLRHLRESETAILEHRPKGFVFEVCERAARCDRQKRLVTEYLPVLQRNGSRKSS